MLLTAASVDGIILPLKSFRAISGKVNCITNLDHDKFFICCWKIFLCETQCTSFKRMYIHQGLRIAHLWNADSDPDLYPTSQKNVDPNHKSFVACIITSLNLLFSSRFSLHTEPLFVVMMSVQCHTMAKRSCQFVYMNSLNKNEQDFLDKQ